MGSIWLTSTGTCGIGSATGGTPYYTEAAFVYAYILVGSALALLVISTKMSRKKLEIVDWMAESLVKEEAASRMAFFQIGAAGHQGSKLPYSNE